MQTSFERFVDDNARALLGSAYLLTGDRHAAEDLLQDALERVFVHWARIKDPLPYTRTVMAAASPTAGVLPLVDRGRCPWTSRTTTSLRPIQPSNTSSTPIWPRS